jgi:phospholipid/cholesterol/gamma-HCH transport system permease protein
VPPAPITSRLLYSVDEIDDQKKPCAGVQALPIVSLVSFLIGLILAFVGGAVVAVSILDLTFVEYYTEVITAVTLADFAAGIFMAVVFGAIVAVIGCLRGIICGRSSQAVGLATTSAVVSSMVLIVIACALLTVIYNALGI